MRDVLACPACGGHLDEAFTCEACGAPFPVLGGVPVLVPDPISWIASYRDAALATLAEHGLVDAETVDAVVALARELPHAERRAFGDDWEPDGLPAARAGLPQDRLGPLLRRLLPASPGRTLEVGCGAEPLTDGIVVDLSLRAVLRARRTDGAVADADALRLHSESVDTIVAANLVDLLTDPDAFVVEAARALRPGGTLLLCTPEPPEGLADLVAECGLDVDHDEDDVIWTRRLSARHAQVYAVRVLRARA